MVEFRFISFVSCVDAESRRRQQTLLECGSGGVMCVLCDFPRLNNMHMYTVTMEWVRKPHFQHPYRNAVECMAPTLTTPHTARKKIDVYF